MVADVNRFEMGSKCGTGIFFNPAWQRLPPAALWRGNCL
jgi:hypothetical protein